MMPQGSMPQPPPAERSASLPMDDAARRRLAVLEDVVKAGLAGFMRVGMALVEIRDKRLYRAGYSTFKAYCRERWGFGMRNATYLITGAKIAGELAGPVKPATKEQVRHLIPLRPDQRQEAWDAACEEAGGQPTGPGVGDAVRSIMDQARQGLPARELADLAVAEDKAQAQQGQVFRKVSIADALEKKLVRCRDRLRALLKAFRSLGSPAANVVRWLEKAGEAAGLPPSTPQDGQG